MGIALVTGGTSGIGAEFARQLAARGHDLILVARDTARLDAMAAELAATGREVEILAADLSSEKDTARVAKRLSDTGKPVDILVNNAGFGGLSKLANPDIAEQDRAYAVMMRAVWMLSAAVVPGMKERGRGAIVNVGSTAGQLSMGAYSSIKAWVTTYSESLANELHGTGVTVTCLMPGWVRTEFHQRASISSSSIPDSLWLDAEHLVRVSLRDMERGRVISIPSVRYGLLSWLLRHLPRSTVRAVSRRISLSRSKAASE
ncbi:MAG: SDR family oxidoreductase [Actinomycetota bacterium]|nr:SDR family oxidoreductase [Actinomycetota bacterium]HWM35398.1 SDR family oxidoreductase [Pseudolysinimonas sp.]